MVKQWAVKCRLQLDISVSVVPIGISTPYGEYFRNLVTSTSGKRAGCAVVLLAFVLLQASRYGQYGAIMTKRHKRHTWPSALCQNGCGAQVMERVHKECDQRLDVALAVVDGLNSKSRCLLVRIEHSAPQGLAIQYIIMHLAHRTCLAIDARAPQPSASRLHLTWA